jgi:hypothetical protein
MIANKECIQIHWEKHWISANVIQGKNEKRRKRKIRTKKEAGQKVKQMQKCKKDRVIDKYSNFLHITRGGKISSSGERGNTLFEPLYRSLGE